MEKNATALTNPAAAITPTELSLYRATARRREQHAQQTLQRRTERARVLAQQAAALLREKFGARRVILFGSLARGALLHPRSDIDLAVEGVPPEVFWQAWCQVDALSYEFEFDLVMLEVASIALQRLATKEAGPQARSPLRGWNSSP